MFEHLIRFIRALYAGDEAIPLHAPVFRGRERDYLRDCLDSTFVSSVGPYVTRLESEVAAYTGSPAAVATVNGTAALHVALLVAGVAPGDLVITQPLTFVATCNAIAYLGAEPAFVDVERATLGLSPAALEAWLAEHATRGDDGTCRTHADGRPIRACVPMHTFGHPVALAPLSAICERWGIALVEDAAESLGSLYEGRHTGTFGRLGALSFNGNKILTTGGGGMILADAALAGRARHLTTTARRSQGFEYTHDAVGFNARLPNLNAALGCAQIEQIEGFVAAKRVLAARYAEHLRGSDLELVTEPPGCRSNYWLNAVICADRAARDALLEATNRRGIGTRPAWTLMHRLPMYAGCPRGDLATACWLADRVVNLPSGVPPHPGG